MADTITFNTTDFYMMMGYFALPPWGENSEFGGDTDCALLAQKIIEYAERIKIDV